MSLSEWNHPLLEESKWNLRGTLFIRPDDPVSLCGQWLVSAEETTLCITVALQPSRDTMTIPAQEMRYTLSPGGIDRTWQARHSLLGDFAGEFFSIEETLISRFCGIQEKLQGIEVFQQFNDNLYIVKGVITRTGTPTLRWSLMLER